MPVPKIVVHADARIINPLLQVCEQLGFSCERRGYGLQEIRTPGEAHLVWGMAFRPNICRELADLGNVFIVENGWFTQRTGCYIDRDGSNAMSSIRGANRCRRTSPDQVQQVSEFVADLHRRVKLRPVPNEKDYILVPLQVEKDTQLLFWSECKAKHPNRQVWFVDQVCRAFPHERLIIRPHRREKSVVDRLESNCRGLMCHSNVSFRSDGTSYNWIAGAKAVVGINSTVLLEALTFYKPVCAMGTGIFTDNGVMLECRGDPTILRELPDYQPDRERITAFLHLLMERQVPYNLSAVDVPKYPVFVAMLECARQRQSRSNKGS